MSRQKRDKSYTPWQFARDVASHIYHESYFSLFIGLLEILWAVNAWKQHNYAQTVVFAVVASSNLSALLVGACADVAHRAVKEGALKLVEFMDNCFAEAKKSGHVTLKLRPNGALRIIEKKETSK